jgi:hypothetical protein
MSDRKRAMPALRGWGACLLLVLAGCDSGRTSPSTAPTVPIPQVPKLADFRSDLSGEDLWRQMDILRSRPPVGGNQAEARALRRQHEELLIALAGRVADSEASARTKSQAGMVRLEALAQLALANAPLVEADLPGLQSDREAFFNETARVMAEQPGTPVGAEAARLQVTVAARYMQLAGPSLNTWIRRFAEYACQQAAGYANQAPDARRDLASAAGVAESAGLTDSAATCYETWAKSWPDDPESPLVPATIVRLHSNGKPFPLKGPLYPKGEFDIASLKGKWVIVHLWRTAGNGAEVMARLERQVDALRARNCEVVGICLDPDEKQLAQLVSTGRIRSTQLYEAWTGDAAKHPLAGQFGIAPPPFSMLIDREGNVVDNNFRLAEMASWVDKLLAQPAK